MKVEVLYFAGCRNHEAFMPRLRTLLDRAGVDEEVRLVHVESDDEAQATGFLGSPSLRVDGRDVEAGAAERGDFGLKCRLYQTSGGLSGTPPDELVLAALTHARASSTLAQVFEPARE